MIGLVTLACGWLRAAWGVWRLGSKAGGPPARVWAELLPPLLVLVAAWNDGRTFALLGVVLWWFGGSLPRAKTGSDTHEASVMCAGALILLVDSFGVSAADGPAEMMAAAFLMLVPFLRGGRMRIVAVVALVVLLAGIWYRRPRPLTHEDLRTYVESFPPDDDLRSWDEWELVAAALPGPLDLSRARAQFRAQSARVSLNGASLYGPPARMGLLDDEAWSRIRREFGGDELLRGTGAFELMREADPVVRALIEGGLDDARRDHLAARIRATLREQRHLEVRRRGLDLLARLDRGGMPREETLRLLADCWSGIWGDSPFAAAFEGGPRRRGRVHDDVPVEFTVHAVELMIRHGVPDGVELARVRAFLLNEALTEGFGHQQHVATAALARLESELMPDGPFWWDTPRMRLRLREAAALLLIVVVYASVLRASSLPAVESDEPR